MQGCPLRCAGCCNEDFQDFSKAVSILTPAEVSEWIVSNISTGIRGLSLSGGEPLHPSHLPAIREAIGLARERAYFDVLAFTGYDDHRDLDLSGIDLLIAGPYEETLRHDAGLVSSRNQRVIRLTDAFSDVPDDWFWTSERAMEVLLEDSVLHVTGLVHPDEVRRFLNGH